MAIGRLAAEEARAIGLLKTAGRSMATATGAFQRSGAPNAVADKAPVPTPGGLGAGAAPEGAAPASCIKKQQQDSNMPGGILLSTN